MITVIIAGGSGTRLWPLSTPEYPKHLLKLTGERTMLQTTYDRAVKMSNTIYVVTEASHSDFVRKQLPELPESSFLIEPGRRGTARCIIFALDVISRRHDHDEPIAFIHSDHYIRDVSSFIRTFNQTASVSQDRHKITLVGVEPTYPSTGFGYIERDGTIDADADVFSVQSFKEKPDYDTAVKYIESGNYLWNCGYFVGSFNTFVDEMKRSAPDLYEDFNSLSTIKAINSKHYQETYLNFNSQVIDVALIEKAKDLIVVSASFDWMDIGSFKDLHDVVPQDENGNYQKGENIYTVEVSSVYIRNEETKPVVVIGLDDIVVVNTANGILISRKEVSSRVGEVAKEINSKKNS
jgi:mannose-1-phosphate guanylyltransferase/mannose-6-phosphate isomerase